MRTLISEWVCLHKDAGENISQMFNELQTDLTVHCHVAFAKYCYEYGLWDI
jgi:hypothetical protein